MSYIVTMSEVGRNKADIERKFSDAPEYNDLYSMAGKHLLSSEVDFVVRSGEYPICEGAVVVGGFRPVGKFKIAEIRADSSDRHSDREVIT